MTVIKPVSLENVLDKVELQEASQKAKLNLSEVLALNDKFGTKLEYVPNKDIVEFSISNGASTEQSKEFTEWCVECASQISKKFNSCTHVTHVCDSKKNTFEVNLESAIEKLKSVMK